jgi:autotransporter-associated beta strand protein
MIQFNTILNYHCALVCWLVCQSFSLVRAESQPSATLTPVPASAPGQVAISWPAVPGATGYNLKRATNAGGPHTLLASITDTNYTDTNAMVNVTGYYAVTTMDSSGESRAFREVAAATVLIADNSDTVGVTFAGSWVPSSVAGYYGPNSVFASTTNSSVPTAACTFVPSLSATANYDLYLRWTANPNRATNVPVDIVFADGQTTVTVDQTTNGGAWILLGTFPCEAGGSNRITLRNNTGGTGKYVVADAVQFVPRLSPWTPRGTGMEDYTVTTFYDNISGTNLDASNWAIALGRPNVSVADGKISLDIEYIGTNPITQATAAELKDPNNWKKGAVQPLNDQKFGYYEARFRVNQDGGGVDNAYWFPASMEEGHWEGYEYDVPEIFTQPVPNFGNTDASYGIWNHVNGAHLWDTNANPPSYSNVGSSWGLTNYHAFGLEWRTDNSLVIYFDGVPLSRALPSKVNALATILPAVPVLSTWVGQWMQPTTNLHGQSMKIDYLRCYQKPGWLGAVSGTWTNAANWGVDGIPGAGYAAVFNMNAAQSTITLPTNQPVQSLSFDNTNLSATTINGPGALLLGAGTNSVLNGGIAMGSLTTTTQTVNAAIIAQKDLSFYNNSGNNAPLILNGVISGDGVALRGIHFICGAPILVSQPLRDTIGEVVTWGGSPLALPTNCTYSGRTVIDATTFLAGRIGNGGQPSSVGTSSANATNLVLFSNRIHSTPYRPRLRYTGPGDVSDRGILITPAAEGILEASGTGPLTLTGPVILDPEKLITGNTNTAPSLILGGTNTGTNTLGSDFITTNGLNLTLTKSDGGTWVLTGNIVLSNNLSVTGGRLQIGAGTSGSLSANSVVVGGGTEFALGRDDDLIFTVPVTGSGGFRKLGAGQLTLAGTNTYSGKTTVDAGVLLNDNTGAGALIVNGGVFDLNGANRSAGQVILSGGIITNSSGGNNYYLSGSALDLQSGNISARVGGFGAAVKTTSGTVTLTGGNSFLGGTTVSNGTLILKSPGTLSSAVVVNGGTFGGTGTVDDTLTINGGSHAPGLSPGVMTVNSNYTLNASGTLQMEIFGTAPGTQYDQLKVTGANSLVTLAGVLEIVTTNTQPVGTTFCIITNTGSQPVSGTFANRPQDSGFVADNTNWFRISYTGGSGNDVILTRIATPAAPTISASLSSGLPRLTLTGPTNVNYQVLASTNLLNWVPILTTNPPALPLVWTDSAATNFSTRFYCVTMGL